MKRFWKKHPAMAVFFAFSFVCLLLFLLFRPLPAFAEWFARYPALGVRFLLGAVTSILPFSLFEIIIALAVLHGIFLLGLGAVALMKKCRRKKAPRFTGKAFLFALLVLLSVFDLYVFTLAPCYFRFSTADAMALDTNQVDEEQIFFALEQLSEIVNEAAPELSRNEEGESLPSGTEKEIREKVVEAANAFGDRNDFYQSRGFAAKSFLSSPLMTYTHLSGVYGFFTGEANVNTNYPHFIVTATCAHETCHSRGIAPENECNFLAAVILMESRDPYLRYCGASFVMDDLLSVCNKLDRERAQEIMAKTDPILRLDWAAYSRFFDRYRDNTAAKVADTANSTYLKAMGQKEGTVSYSRIIRLTAAYFHQKSLEN